MEGNLVLYHLCKDVEELAEYADAQFHDQKGEIWATGSGGDIVYEVIS